MRFLSWVDVFAVVMRNCRVAFESSHSSEAWELRFPSCLGLFFSVIGYKESLTWFFALESFLFVLFVDGIGDGYTATTIPIGRSIHGFEFCSCSRLLVHFFFIAVFFALEGVLLSLHGRARGSC